jgi:hypothetical protein
VILDLGELPIAELAKTGERNPDLLCEAALKNLRGHLLGD